MKRFNIEESLDKDAFRNRCLETIYKFFEGKANERENVTKYSSNFSRYMGLNLYDRYNGIRNLYINSWVERLNLSSENNYLELIEFLEFTLNYFDNKEFANEISSDIALSNADVILCENDDKYELYPKENILLDNALKIDVLNWLDEYKNAKESFSKALKTEMNEDYYRHIIDDMRFALEQFLKKYFENDKSLENQKSEIGKLLKDYNDKEFANMFEKLLEYYGKYNNENAKHNEKEYDYAEVDFIIYLTGSFMRFLILLKKECKS